MVADHGDRSGTPQGVPVKRWSILLSACAAWACGGGESNTSNDSAAPAAATAGVADLTGAGATFPYPLYRAWVSDFHAKTGAQINYQNIGSGGGIKQLSE